MINQVRILMFADGFGSTTTTFIYNEVRYLSKQHQVKFLCLKRMNEVRFPHNDVEVLSFPELEVWKKIKWRLWKKDLYLSFKNKSFAQHLNKIVQEYKPDIIHCHFAYEALKVLENLSTISIPVVVHFHGYDASEMLQRNVYIKKLRKYISKDYVFPIYVSETMKIKLEEKRIDLSKGFLLRYGIDTQLFQPSSEEPNKENKTFLQVSSLVEKKGHKFTLLAFSLFLKKVKNPSLFRLVFTGGGENLERFEALAEKYKIQNNVDFVGFVDSAKAKLLMQEADFFVHHSVTTESGDQEGIPNAIIEAMAMELPILSTNHAGISELVEDGVNGYLVNEKDVEAYANKMLKILSWNSCPHNRQKVVDNYEYEKHNQYLEKVYLTLSHKAS